MKRLPAHERVWLYIDKRGPNECWPWMRSKSSHGYGTIRQKCHTRNAHVVAYESLHGPMPKGMCLCHKCDNRICCNPGHMFVGTHAENARDRVAKGRSNTARGVAAGSAKLTDTSASLARHLAECGVAQHRVASLFGVTQMTINALLHRRTWTHVPDLMEAA